METNMRIKSENIYRWGPSRDIINIIPLLILYMCTYISSRNTNACILWKLITCTEHTEVQSTVKTAHNHRRTAVPIPLFQRYNSPLLLCHTSFYTGARKGSHQLEEKLQFFMHSVFISTGGRGNLWQCFSLPSQLEGDVHEVEGAWDHSTVKALSASSSFQMSEYICWTLPTDVPSKTNVTKHSIDAASQC